MSEEISARECSSTVIVSTGPDVCMTPVGSSLVPVAYTSVALAGESTRVSPTVLDNERPDFHLNSRICTSTGHEAGVGAGMVAPGYLGEALVSTASPTVFTDGWATARHRDPAMINRPDSGAVEPQIERTGYYEQILRRIAGREEARSLEACYADDVEADLPSRDLSPGTNESVESANGAAMLVTGATAPPEEDYRRRPGETEQEYFERLEPLIRERPRPGEVAAQVERLERINDAILSDPDYHAWAQGLDPAVFHDPLSVPGIEHNELLSRTATRNPGDMEPMLRMGDPYSFAGADGQVYSGDASSVVRQPGYLGGAQAQLDQQYARWRAEVGDPVPPDYNLSAASRAARAARDQAKKLGRLGVVIRGHGSSPFVPDTAAIPRVSVPMGF